MPLLKNDMIDEYLEKAYTALLGKEPDGLEEWVVAKEIMQNYDGRKLTEDFWQEVFFVIINHIQYPNKEVTNAIVGAAEDMYSELMGVVDEPHMAAVEADEYAKRERFGPRK